MDTLDIDLLVCAEYCSADCEGGSGSLQCYSPTRYPLVIREISIGLDISGVEEIGINFLPELQRQSQQARFSRLDIHIESS